MTLVYLNTISKKLYKQLFRTYDFPQLDDYLQQFEEHTLEFSELVEIGTEILHHDRGDIIKQGSVEENLLGMNRLRNLQSLRT